jgi:hypothetical protein
MAKSSTNPSFLIEDNLPNFFTHLFGGVDSWGSDKFHLSDSGTCIRQIVLRIQGGKGEDRDTGSKLTLALGQALHNLLQGKLVDQGYVTRAECEVPTEDKELNLRGSADVVVAGTTLAKLLDREDLPGGLDCDYILDFKSKKDSILDSGEQSFARYTTAPEPSHTSQMQGYMEFLDIEWALVLYVNKNDGSCRGFWLRRNRMLGGMIREKARMVEEFRQQGTLPEIPYEKNTPEWVKNCKGIGRKDGSWAFRCGYYFQCFPTEEN